MINYYPINTNDLYIVDKIYIQNGLINALGIGGGSEEEDIEIRTESIRKIEHIFDHCRLNELNIPNQNVEIKNI